MFSRFLIWSVLVVSSIFFVWCASPKTIGSQPQEQPAVPQVCFEKKCRSVEIADEPKEQQQGLMNRTVMDENAGMLFIFKQIGSRQFRMKDTLIPLDMIWIDGKQEIVHIATDVPPCLQWDACPGYGPTAKNSLYVLELNAGQVAKFGLITWAKLTLPTP
jgi:uncharacterized membrane protein (UPF0127 family)